MPIINRSYYYFINYLLNEAKKIPPKKLGGIFGFG